jgi:parvulin-like peptidyl-prolyl isomerase
MVALSQAQMAFAQDQIVVKPEEIKKFYDENKDVFSQVRIKVIYIPFSSGAASQGTSDSKTLTEAEAKAKTEKLYADIQAGADFVKLVKANSGDPTSVAKDGDYGVISRSENLPEEIKTAVFALKQGQVTKPVRLPNGYYLLRAEEFILQPFEKVRAQISDDLLNMRMNDWVKATQGSIEVKILSPDVLPAAPAATAPVK